MVSLVVMAICAGSPQSSQLSFSDITANPLVGVVIGGIIALAASLLAGRQQLKRDQEAYKRSLKDAKRERLRSSYKVLLNAADKYQFEIQQITHIPSEVNIALTGVDEAVTEISLEDIGTDVLSIFYELRGAFHTHGAHQNSPSEGSWEEVMKQKKTVLEKYEQLKAAMNRHLKELES